jgi:hypothetical protein
MKNLTAICELMDWKTPQVSIESHAESFSTLYDDVRTSQEARLWASTACYGDSFTSSYAYDVRTSQEAHLGAFTSVTGIASLLCMHFMFVPHRKHT